MKNRFYITTAIAYVNASPHIGFALELLQADALARFHRQQGDEVFFLTGTDEHGTKIFRTATEAGHNVQEFVDTIAPQFQRLAEELNCSNSDFIRTSDQKRHWPGVGRLWRKLVEVDAIYKGLYEGYYCVGCEAYLAESDLDDGRCPIHGSEPEHVKEENYFFRLSQYQEQVREVITNGRFRVLPRSREKELLALIDQRGLDDVSFSRPKEKLPWGVPVPGDDDHVMYVWADALPNYLTGIGYGHDDALFKQWWPADVHVIGKDILRFHAAIWPAMLMAAGIELPRAVFSHGFITVEGSKMSKSKGNVVDPFDLIERYGVDAVRYYLLREIPSGDDGDFSEERFRERYNADLANGIGNLVSRVVTIAAKNNIEIANATIAPSLQQQAEHALQERNDAMAAFRLHDALASVAAFVTAVDQYIEQTKPWEVAQQSDDDHLREILQGAAGALEHIANLLMPFLPDTAQRIISIVESGTIQTPLFPRLD